MSPPKVKNPNWHAHTKCCTLFFLCYVITSTKILGESIKRDFHIWSIARSIFHGCVFVYRILGMVNDHLSPHQSFTGQFQHCWLFLFAKRLLALVGGPCSSQKKNIFCGSALKHRRGNQMFYFWLPNECVFLKLILRLSLLKIASKQLVKEWILSFRSFNEHTHCLSENTQENCPHQSNTVQAVLPFWSYQVFYVCSSEKC